MYSTSSESQKCFKKQVEDVELLATHAGTTQRHLLGPFIVTSPKTGADVRRSGSTANYKLAAVNLIARSIVVL